MFNRNPSIFSFIKYGWIFFFIAINFTLGAQVINNRIEDRLELKLDSTSTPSTTANATVDWSCINKALTKKCLVYHNDQWFQFTPPTKGKYFLNLSSQQCRDLQGVQLIIIEGNPCEVASYKILQCIPKIFQDDVFVELDSLQANMNYLVNIDGFLGDFCEFDIQFSSTPRGLPRTGISFDTLNLAAQINTKGVLLEWHVDQSLLEKISKFEVYRFKIGEVKSTLTFVMSARGNALGAFVENYSFTDTLSARGMYQYKIIGVEREAESRLLLDQVKINFNPLTSPEKQTIVKVPFLFASKGRVEIFVINKADHDLLDYSVREFVEPETVSINLTKFVDYGIQQFWIKLRHIRSKELKQHIFVMNETGELVLREDK